MRGLAERQAERTARLQRLAGRLRDALRAGGAPPPPPACGGVGLVLELRPGAARPAHSHGRGGGGTDRLLRRGFLATRCENGDCLPELGMDRHGT